MSGKNLFVVVCIDTEGPIDDPRKPEILNSWERVFGLADRLFARAFRAAHPDSDGRPAVFSWFVLTLSGFTANPFRRPMGHHQVLDPYLERYGEAMAAFGDGIYWHYHHPSASGAANEWSADWTHCREYDAILAHLVMERDRFPCCYRAGGRIENDDASWWLEEIIPFDYSNCSGNIDWDNPESDGRRLGDVCDWRRAPDDWSFYHPSEEDYQAPGGQRRLMFRCPDLHSGVHRLDDDDIRRAFARAGAGRSTVLSFFEHDRREVTAERLAGVFGRVASIATEFPDVSWRYTNARDAAVRSAGIAEESAPEFRFTPCEGGRLMISADGAIFGRQPFVAGRSSGSPPHRLAVLTVGRRRWVTEPLPRGCTQVTAAANSPSGRAGISHFRFA